MKFCVLIAEWLCVKFWVKFSLDLVICYGSFVCPVTFEAALGTASTTATTTDLTEKTHERYTKSLLEVSVVVASIWMYSLSTYVSPRST